MSTLLFYKTKVLLGLSGDDWPDTLLAKQIAVLQFPNETIYQILGVTWHEQPMSTNQLAFANMLEENAQKSFAHFSKVWNVKAPKLLYGDEFTNFLASLELDKPTSFKGLRVILLERHTNGLPKRWSIPKFSEFYTSPRFSRSELHDWLKLIKIKPSDLLSDWLGEDGKTNDNPPETRPSCGTKAIHKLIDRAFYSINKPPEQINHDDVSAVIRQEYQDNAAKRIIDINHIVTKIDGNVIYWQTSDGAKKPISFPTFQKHINSLKTATIADSKRHLGVI